MGDKHSGEIRPRGDGYLASCACGWSVRCKTQDEAITSYEKHEVENPTTDTLRAKADAEADAQFQDIYNLINAEKAMRDFLRRGS